MSPPEHKTPGFWGTFRSYLVGGSVLSVLAGVVGLMPALIAPTMFGVPGAVTSPILWATFWAVVSFPIICFLAPVASYFAYRNGRSWLAVMALLTPFAVAAVFTALWFLIQEICGGSFTC